MFLSFDRNSSSDPLSCGFGLGFIPYPQNKNRKISALTTPKPCNLSKPQSTEIANELANLLNF
jgi:hypothetical protein